MSMPPLMSEQYAARVTGTVSDVAKLRYQIDTYLRQRNPNAPAVGRYYAEFGAKFSIRPEIAVGQAIIETASFRFTGQVPASYHNPSGMKCNGAFVRFTNWEQGIHAHLERLNCYVRPSDESGEGGKYDPCYGHWRHTTIKEMGYNPDSIIGVASLWLGKCDPSNTGCIENMLRYAQGITQHAEAILTVPYTPGAPEPKPQPGKLALSWWPWLLIGTGILTSIIISYRRER